MPSQLLLLHGAIGSSAQLQPLADSLRRSGFEPKLFDFVGHGGREMPSGPFSIQSFAEEVIRWMDAHSIERTNIFGYSMGGYVALYLAKHHPGRVGKIMTVATKLAWDVPTSEKEVKMLNPEKIAEKIPKFALALEQRHSPQDWKQVLARTAEMMTAIGADPPLKEEDFHSIPHDVQMCVGDRDAMVSIEETVSVYRMLKNASLAVLPSTPHPIEQMSTELLTTNMTRFFNS